MEQLSKNTYDSKSPFIFTAKKSGHDTGYEIFKDYSENSVKISNKGNIAIYLPSKLIDISLMGEIYWIHIPRWLYNKNYAFFNS
jgi:hypothetical protein